MRGEPPVEVTAPPERAVDQLRAESRLAGVETRLLEGVLENDVGEGAVFLHAHEDAQRLVARLGDRARAQHRAHAPSSVITAPGPRRAPRRNSSQAMGFRLSG